MVGAGRVDLWVRSSTPNVDLQATISEVRPDGKETFVQNGWVRANERALDAAKSTELEPVLSLRAADVSPMPSDHFVPVTVPLYYEGHAYRAGSRIRVRISAPNGDQPIWSFSETEPAGTAEVEIGYGDGMPSRLVLPQVPGVTVPAQLPPCPGLRGEPCRDYVPFENDTSVLDGYPRPKGATPFRVPLAIAYNQCTSPNSQHGAPLSVGSCSPPEQASDYLTVGTLDANGQAANSTGSVRYDVTGAGDVSVERLAHRRAPQGQPRRLHGRARRGPDGRDHRPPKRLQPGRARHGRRDSVPVRRALHRHRLHDDRRELLAHVELQRDRAGLGRLRRARELELGQVQVNDGGADNDADTAGDNTPFAVQGVFAP